MKQRMNGTAEGLIPPQFFIGQTLSTFCLFKAKHMFYNKYGNLSLLGLAL